MEEHLNNLKTCRGPYLDIDPYILVNKSQIHLVSVTDPDPGYGIWCLFDPWIHNSGSGMINPDHISPELINKFLG
jgi:hypothetical protein